MLVSDYNNFVSTHDGLQQPKTFKIFGITKHKLNLKVSGAGAKS